MIKDTSSFVKKQKIFSSAEELREYLDALNIHSHNKEIVTISGGFDPSHSGHVRYIQAADKLKGSGVLIVIVNKDSWLMRKKGFVFMKEDERAEILAAFSGVDYVVTWDDGTPSVSGCLEILKPTIFANGGDRTSAENTPEFEVCQKIDCQMVFDVGGGKIQSSSDLVKKHKNK